MAICLSNNCSFPRALKLSRKSLVLLVTIADGFAEAATRGAVYVGLAALAATGKVAVAATGIDGGSVDVLVSLEQEVAIPLSVNLVILSATAMEGHGMAYCVTPKNILTHIMFHSDFNVTSSSRLTFNRKQNQSFTVFVVDDDETEEKESFTLSLIQLTQ